jgi:hypothetical protein
LKRARLVLCGALACGACSKAEPAPHRTQPWLANPSASSSRAVSSAPRTFHFADGSSVGFSAPGRKGKVSGHAPVSAGSLRLDPNDLKSVSASLDVDLTRLAIDEDGAPPEAAALAGSTPSAVALQWLELGPGVPAERRAEFATARFELAAVDNLSAPLLDFGAAHPHRVRATAIGTLLIHGFKEPVRAEVLLEPQKSAPGAPLRLSIRSASALVIALAPHEITARGPSGIVDAAAMARSADWVGKNVRLEFELVAEAERPSTK